MQRFGEELLVETVERVVGPSPAVELLDRSPEVTDSNNETPLGFRPQRIFLRANIDRTYRLEAATFSNSDDRPDACFRLVSDDGKGQFYTSAEFLYALKMLETWLYAEPSDFLKALASTKGPAPCQTKS
jgi:hypothetical protein